MMKISSVKLNSAIITVLVVIAVALWIFFTEHTLSDAVSADARMIPIYKVGCRVCNRQSFVFSP